MKGVNMKQLENKPFFTTAELSNLLGISTVAVHKKIKSGRIKAEMIGGSYIISRDEVSHILNIDITDEDKEAVKKAVEKTVKEYGAVLKMLGKE